MAYPDLVNSVYHFGLLTCKRLSLFTGIQGYKRKERCKTYVSLRNSFYIIGHAGGGGGGGVEMGINI